jgi:hypothetical protein
MKLTVTIAMIAAAVQYGLVFGQTETSRKAANLPSDLHATLQSHPAVKEYLQ